MKIDTKSLADAFAANANGAKKSGGDFSAAMQAAAKKQPDAAAELEKYMKMTPAQRMTQAMLKKLGLTQDEFDALPPDQQAAITARIAEMIKQEMSKQAAQQKDGGAPTLF